MLLVTLECVGVSILMPLDERSEYNLSISSRDVRHVPTFFLAHFNTVGTFRHINQNLFFNFENGKKLQKINQYVRNLSCKFKFH